MGSNRFNFIYYSSKDRKAVVLLLVLLLAISSANYIIISNRTISDKTAHELELIYIQHLEAKKLKDLPVKINNTSNKKNLSTSVATDDKNEQPAKKWSPFEFNPNEIADSLWLHFGLSEKQVSVITNYKNKGGSFQSAEDLKKVYSISDDAYDRISPFVKIKNVTSDSTIEKSKVQKTPELNTCKKSDLIRLLNIDPDYANAIVDYRRQLGGYYSLEQLTEIKNIPDSIARSIAQYVQLDNRYLSKKNVNIDAAFQLQHPYISKGLANLIENYRREHGDYQSTEDLKKLSLMNNELYSKLLPYLIVE